ncbi:hypothetical protein ABKV19_000811 [Rosa sericea]
MVKRFDNWGVNSASLDPVVCRSITMDLNSQGFPNCSVLLWRISKWEWRIQMAAKYCTVFVKRIIGIPGLPSLVQGLEDGSQFCMPLSWCPSFGIQSHRKTRLILVEGVENSNACRVLHCICQEDHRHPWTPIFGSGA